MVKRSVISILLLLFAITCIFCSFTQFPTCASSDPVYDSMTLPSESQSDYMKRSGLVYGKIMGDTSSSLSVRAISMGSMYRTHGETLPSNFSIYLGKINLFAYSLSRKRWIILDSQPYPTGITLITLPWETGKPIKCNNITYTDDYAKIDLTADELNSCVLHFWGKQIPIDKTDYAFYACAYSFWVDDNAAGKITATSGIDTKGGKEYKTITQLYASRGLSASQYIKTQWGHTVPNKYYAEFNTSSLNELFKNGSVEPNLFSGEQTKSLNLIDPNQAATKITKLTALQNSIKIKWKKKANKISGYQIQYSTDKNFKSNCKTKRITSSKKKAKTITSLVSHQKYYIRIRTYRKVGKITLFSKWSKTKSITIN